MVARNVSDISVTSSRNSPGASSSIARTPGSSSLEADSASRACPPAPGAPPSAAQTPATADGRLESVRNHLRRYRDLAAQGKWSEAGKELEAIEAEVK